MTTRALGLIAGALVCAACDVPISGYYVERGSQLYGAGRYSEATTAYRKAIKVLPENGPARVGLGNALWKLGQREECLQVHDEAMVVAPDYAPAYTGKAFYLVQMNRRDEAITVLEKLAERQPNARLLAHIGLLFLDVQRHADAVRALREAVSMDPRVATEMPRVRAGLEEAEASLRREEHQGQRE